MEELRKKAKEKGLKGWSSLNKPQLQRLVDTGLRPNQVSVSTQTPCCHDCGLDLVAMCLAARAEKEDRKEIVYCEDGTLVDPDTGEVLGYHR